MKDAWKSPAAGKSPAGHLPAAAAAAGKSPLPSKPEYSYPAAGEAAAVRQVSPTSGRNPK